MLKKIILFTMFVSTFISCKKSEVYKQELNTYQILTPGEWISSSDTSSGISIREDKLAFYRNETFKSEDIFKYQIIDSVIFQDKKEKIITSYLKTFDSKDTIYYKIIEIDKTRIKLNLKNGKIESFNLKKK